MNEQPTIQNGRKGQVVAINRSDGGVPKSQIAEAFITELGIEGDRQANPNIHGGPERAVTVFSLEVIQALAREGHPIGIGTTGENLTVSHLDWTLVAPGSELMVGPVRLQVTKMAAPCFKIKDSFENRDESRISHKLHPGWSRACARVLQTGTVRVGDPVELV
jgi:MOSC domain-containing protein YiiM